MSRFVLTARAVLLGVLLVSCSGGSDNPAGGDERLSAAQRRLAELAGLAAKASYDVTYTVVAATGEQGTVRIVAVPPSFRVDVIVSGAPSTFIQHGGSTVSCAMKSGRPACLLVARPGEPVPDVFDPGVQRLFTDAVADLAAHPERYVVTTASPTAAPDAESECFEVRRLAASASPSPTSDPTGFETGQYCFADDGVMTRLSVVTGTLTQAGRGPKPTAALFVPPATPVALPDLPSPSPS